MLAKLLILIVFGNHWTFPGPSIDDHLKKGHNVKVKGLTQEELLNLHDALHEMQRKIVWIQPYKT